eukprot:291699_1
MDFQFDTAFGLFALLFTLYVSLSTYFFYFPPVYVRNTVRKCSRPLSLGAHRGGMAESLENSMASFKHSVVGCNANLVETDVHLTSDKVLVLTHDNDLSRRFNLEGRVTETKYADLPRRWVHNGEEREEEEFVTLEELFKEFPDTWINLDIKMGDAETIRKTGELIRKYKRQSRTVWGGHFESTAQLCYQEDPDIPVYISYAGFLRTILLYYTGLLPFIPLKESFFEFPLTSNQQFRADVRKMVSNDLYYLLARFILFLIAPSPRLIRHFKDRGMRVIAFVLNDIDEFEHVHEELKVDGIMTDKPSLLQKYFEVKRPSFGKIVSAPKTA